MVFSFLPDWAAVYEITRNGISHHGVYDRRTNKQIGDCWEMSNGHWMVVSMTRPEASICQELSIALRWLLARYDSSLFSTKELIQAGQE